MRDPSGFLKKLSGTDLLPNTDLEADENTSGTQNRWEGDQQVMQFEEDQESDEDEEGDNIESLEATIRVDPPSFNLSASII